MPCSASGDSNRFVNLRHKEHAGFVPRAASGHFAQQQVTQFDLYRSPNFRPIALPRACVRAAVTCTAFNGVRAVLKVGESSGL